MSNLKSIQDLAKTTNYMSYIRKKALNIKKPSLKSTLKRVFSSKSSLLSVGRVSSTSMPTSPDSVVPSLVTSAPDVDDSNEDSDDDGRLVASNVRDSDDDSCSIASSKSSSWSTSRYGSSKEILSSISSHVDVSQSIKVKDFDSIYSLNRCKIVSNRIPKKMSLKCLTGTIRCRIKVLKTLSEMLAANDDAIEGTSVV